MALFLAPLLGAGLGAAAGGTLAAGTGFTALGLSAGAASGIGVGALAGGSLGLMGAGGAMQANAARSQAEAQNQATMARYQYDMDMWGMKKKQLQAERMEAIERIMVSAQNEGKLRAYKEAQAEQQYQYSLQIRNAQQASNEAAYARSEDIYTDTTDLNSISAKAALNSEMVKYEESQDERRYDEQEAYLNAIMAEGELRATGASGRSAAKGVQVTLADYGRQMEMLNASGDSMTRNTRAVLEEIVRDKTSADLTAYASKMLKPGALPMPIRPEPIPIPTYSLPRALSDYDFGPQPVYGAMADPNAAASMAWGQTITSMAGSIGTMATSLIPG